MFPHLMLFKTKSESDGSNYKTKSRRHKHCHKCELDEIVNKGKALQMLLVKSEKSKEKLKHRILIKIMSNGKKSNAMAKLTVFSKGFLSIKETVKGQTIEQILNEKHPNAEPINSKYKRLCSEDKIFLSTPFYSTK